MMRNNKFHTLIALAMLFLFITGCSHNTAIITFRSLPNGAKVYDSNDNMLGITPFKISYDIPKEIYNRGYKAWDIGSVKAYLEGYEPQIQNVALNISEHRIPGSLFYDAVEKFYTHDVLIEFKSKKSPKNDYEAEYNYDNEFYISSFQDTKAGEYPRKRDSFNKSEIPEVVVTGYKGKLVNTKVHSISSNELIFEHNSYIPEQNDTYLHFPIKNLKPDSYKVTCSVEGIGVKTLFFTVFN